MTTPPAQAGGFFEQRLLAPTAASRTRLGAGTPFDPSGIEWEPITPEGTAHWRVLLRRVLPNIVGPAAVLATANFGAVILNLAGLSFLGLGMQPPTPEWGEMINGAARYFQEYPWQMIAPGLCIAATVLAINLLGDGLRDVPIPARAERRSAPRARRPLDAPSDKGIIYYRCNIVVAD